MTNDGKLGEFHMIHFFIPPVLIAPLLEELLIDFRELVGEHSGENMAEEVWKCVEMYGLEGRVDATQSDDDLPELIPA